MSDGTSVEQKHQGLNPKEGATRDAVLAAIEDLKRRVLTADTIDYTRVEYQHQYQTHMQAGNTMRVPTGRVWFTFDINPNH
jgi:hypothetical protein